MRTIRFSAARVGFGFKQFIASANLCSPFVAAPANVPPHPANQSVIISPYQWLLDRRASVSSKLATRCSHKLVNFVTSISISCNFSELCFHYAWCGLYCFETRFSHQSFLCTAVLSHTSTLQEFPNVLRVPLRVALSSVLSSFISSLSVLESCLIQPLSFVCRFSSQSRTHVYTHTHTGSISRWQHHVCTSVLSEVHSDHSLWPYHQEKSIDHHLIHYHCTFVLSVILILLPLSMVH